MYRISSDSANLSVTTLEIAAEMEIAAEIVVSTDSSAMVIEGVPATASHSKTDVSVRPSPAQSRHVSTSASASVGQQSTATQDPTKQVPATPKTCELCKLEGKATMFCMHCWSDICKSCTDRHKVLAIFKGHALYPMEHFVGNKKPKCSYCRAGNDAAVFCNDCVCSICEKCVTLHNKRKAFKRHQLIKLQKDSQPSAPEKPCGEKPCGACLSGDKAAMHCKTCITDICSACVEHHKNLRIFLKHQLEDLKESSEEEECGSCSLGEKATSYCNTCECSICEACTQLHLTLKVFSDHKLGDHTKEHKPDPVVC